MVKAYLGIDAGTQGLSVVLTDQQMNVLGTASGDYAMVDGLAAGCYEQHPRDWESWLSTAMKMLRHKLRDEYQEFEILCIGISGQMHGEVLADECGGCLGPVRLWCDSRNEEEGNELTERLGVKIPKRMTAARWLWTLRHQTDKARLTRHITTPAGWISYRLTGVWNLGIGDAAGMFPIDQSTLDYDPQLLQSFDRLADIEVRNLPGLAELLPKVCKAGEPAGQLNSNGAALLGLPEGIPVAPAEGDQPAALAGSLIGEAGLVSMSFGTSVCANSVGDRPFQGVHRAVDHFCAADGKPINMVWLRNGTTFMNSVIQMCCRVLGTEKDDIADGFAAVMPMLLESDPDCGGLLALPFMDDEPGLGVDHGGTALILGFNPQNASPGNAARAALLATVFNLRLGGEELDRQGFPRTEIILSGGLSKTPAIGQILADAWGTRVSLLDSAEEGTAWGAALLAKYRKQVLDGMTDGWSTFLSAHRTSSPLQFEPKPENVGQLDGYYRRYQALLNVQPALDQALRRRP